MATCTEKEIKTFIVTSLALADDCARDQLEQIVDELWLIAGYSVGCGEITLRYFTARLKAIELLMSSQARKFDTADSLSNSFQTGQAETRQDGYSAAQAGNQGFRESDSASCSNYDDFAKAKMRSGSERNAKSCSTDISTSTYTDTGSGRNRAVSNAMRDSITGSTSLSKSESSGTSFGGSSRAGCNWTYSREVGSGDSDSTSDGGIALPFGVVPVPTGSFSVSASLSANASESSWARSMYDRTNSRQTDVRKGYSVRELGAESQTINNASASSCSYFNALINSRSSGTSQSRHADDSTAFRNEDAHAEGAGKSFSKADARSEVTAQGTSRAHSDHDAKRDSSRWGTQIGDTVKMSQRFRNLKDLHEITKENLEYTRGLVNARRGVLWDCNIVQLMRDGHCDIKLWLAESLGYSRAVYHPAPVRECCDIVPTKRDTKLASVVKGCATCG